MNYPVVENLDLTRYSGKWYEIAKTLFPKPYESRNCENASALYTVKSNNKLEIINYCINDGNEIGYAKGQGISRDNKGILDIKFDEFNIYGQSLPVDDRGEYVIFWTDYDNFSIVGSPNPSYSQNSFNSFNSYRDSTVDEKMLWVLSRTSQIKKEYIPSIKQFIQDLGYDLNKVYVDKDVLI